jgi:hypothetical protein
VKLHLLGDSGVGKSRLKRSLTRYFNIFSMESTTVDEPKKATERTRGAEISTENIVGTVNADTGGKGPSSSGYSYDHYGKTGSDYKVPL